MEHEPALILFSGQSGSGKTTLIEKLIGPLKAAGLRVGAIKRSHHDVEVDSKGKDSYRFREAGANPAVIAGGNVTGYFESVGPDLSLEYLAGLFAGKADIIIAEGFEKQNVSGRPALKFLFGPPFGKDSGAAGGRNVTGFITVTGEKGPEGKPTFARDDVEALAKWIVNWARR